MASRMRLVIAVFLCTNRLSNDCFPFMMYIFSLCVYIFNKKLQKLIDKYYKYCNNVYKVTILHIDFHINV